MHKRLILGLLASCALGACVTVNSGSGQKGHATIEQLRARAAFEMDCAEGKLTVTPIDARVKGVSGCGRKATYVEVCEKKDINCTWSRESTKTAAKTARK